MFKKSIRVIMRVWENDGNTYIYDYVNRIKECYGLGAVIKDIIRIDNTDYAVILVKGTNGELVKFTRKTTHRLIKYKENGLNYLMVFDM